MSSRKPAVIKEIHTVKISPKDKILVIGLGIFPSTAIVIAEETKAEITGIDHNVFAVNLAKRFISKIGYKARINIEHGNGINYSIKDFDLIFVVINVWPIDSILLNLSKNMKSGAKLICRGFKNDISKIVNKNKLFNNYNLISTLEDPMFSFSKYPKIQSILLIKK